MTEAHWTPERKMAFGNVHVNWKDIAVTRSHPNENLLESWQYGYYQPLESVVHCTQLFIDALMLAKIYEYTCRYENPLKWIVKKGIVRKWNFIFEGLLTQKDYLMIRNFKIQWEKLCLLVLKMQRLTIQFEVFISFSNNYSFKAFIYTPSCISYTFEYALSGYRLILIFDALNNLILPV